jgi:hypothetical protein
MVLRASRGIPKGLRITSLIVGPLAATLAAVQATYTTMSEHRAVSARVLQEKLDAKLDVDVTPFLGPVIRTDRGVWRFSPNLGQKVVCFERLLTALG